MEYAEPIEYETYQTNIDNNEIKFIEEIKIKMENEKYRIQLGIKENDLVIKVLSENFKDMAYYQHYYTLYELQKISQIFSEYKNVKDIVKVLKDLKFQIEKKINGIIIKFNAFMSDGKSKLVELNLYKHLLDNKELIKYLLDEITSIKKDIKSQKEHYNKEKIEHKSEIKDLKEIISKAEIKISSLQKDNMNYKSEIF